MREGASVCNGGKGVGVFWRAWITLVRDAGVLLSVCVFVCVRDSLREREKERERERKKRRKTSREKRAAE